MVASWTVYGVLQFDISLLCPNMYHFVLDPGRCQRLMWRGFEGRSLLRTYGVCADESPKGEKEKRPNVHIYVLIYGIWNIYIYIWVRTGLLHLALGLARVTERPGSRTNCYKLRRCFFTTLCGNFCRRQYLPVLGRACIPDERACIPDGRLSGGGNICRFDRHKKSPRRGEGCAGQRPAQGATSILDGGRIRRALRLCRRCARMARGLPGIAILDRRVGIASRSSRLAHAWGKASFVPPRIRRTLE